MTPKQLTTQQTNARAALLENDLDRLADLQKSIQSQIPCLTDVISSTTWAEHLITLAILAYNQGEDWEPILRAALSASANVDRAVGLMHPLAQATPGKDTVENGLPTPPDLEVFINGNRVLSVRMQQNGPRLVQIRSDDELYSRLLIDSDLPMEWRPLFSGDEGLPTKIMRSRRLRPAFVAGAALGSAGVLLCSGTFYAASRTKGVTVTKRQRDTLVVLNTVGWGAVAGSSALFIAGVRIPGTKGAQAMVTPTGLTVWGTVGKR